MNRYFKFDAAKYDFWPLYETVKKYYPIGIVDEELRQDTLFNVYPGTQQIAQVIHDNISVAKNYKARWKPLQAALKQQLQKPVLDENFLSEPSYKGIVILKKETRKHCTVLQELHFAISLLGPYFCIYGVDSSYLMLAREQRPNHNTPGKEYGYYPAVHAVTVSPSFEYEEAFLLVQAKIAEWFPGYKFVPYHINMMRLKGLLAFGADVHDAQADTIHSALFNSNSQLKADTATRGDTRYSYEQWRKPEPLSAADESNRNLLAQHMLESRRNADSSPPTIHRVWKYKSARIQPPIGLANISSFPILNLTDAKVALYTVEDSVRVRRAPYELANNELLIHAEEDNKPFTIRHTIAACSATELRLTRRLEFDYVGIPQLQERNLEVVFERYT
ncbi:hypothetical protein [Hymenobacter lucidus]|uniref:Uncharacterized protein n=1 Tax=Hymenobacter lucidus TaxID=2880930 RepID=A0ABS8ASF6_9BACT|nr:hypothetical protein [Hymenobacter lucidus]MCB2408694.1 hypothetical protein [Hymenobacter lucidus]